MARTIDNLGVDISTRYAQDQKELDQTHLRESKAIPAQTEIEALTPSFPSEIELLFGLDKRNMTWASFFMPFGYSDQKKRLFSHHIIPELGSEDQKEAQIGKITNFLPVDEVQEDKEKNKKEAWQVQREKEEKEKEKKILLTLLNSIASLDKFLMDVNAKRNQFQRG